MNGEIKKTSKKTVIIIIILSIIISGIGFFIIFKVVKTVSDTDFLCIKSSSFTEEDAYNYLDESYEYKNYTLIERVDSIKDKNVKSKRIRTGFKFRDNTTGQYFYVYWKVSRSEAFHCTEYEGMDTLLDSIIDYYIPKFDNKLEHNYNDTIDINIRNYSSLDEMVSVIYNFRNFLMNNLSDNITFHLKYGITTGEKNRIVIYDYSFHSLDELKKIINEKTTNSY